LNRLSAEAAESQAVQMRAASEATALQWVPELTDPASRATAIAREVLRAHPALEKAPQGPEILAVLVKGALALNLPLPAHSGGAPVRPNGQPKPGRPPPTVPAPSNRLPGNSSAMPAGTGSVQGNSSALLARFAASGNPDDKMAWIKSALAGV
jgi:hypothetical protein